MDLNFTAEELAFRRDIRQWVADNLPKDISHKVHNALRLSRLNLSGKMFATAPYVTAVPEPSTLALAGAGLLSFVGYAVRRRRSAN